MASAVAEVRTVAFDKIASLVIIENSAQRGGVAQTVRACGSYPQCRGLKSLPRYQEFVPRGTEKPGKSMDRKTFRVSCFSRKYDAYA